MNTEADSADDIERKRLEAEFHDNRERDRKLLSQEEFQRTYSNNQFYAITRRSQEYVESLIAQLAPGGHALDYCCGRGGMSLRLARSGARVSGIDISPESIEVARAKLAATPHAANVDFQVMDAENLSFPDSTFDLVICSGVLHHLDVDRAFAQIARVLKPNGTVIAIEALGYNPAIQLYRRLTPKLRTAWETDHILTLREVDRARKFYDDVDVKFFHLASLGAVPLRKRPALFEPVLKGLELVDELLLRIPLVQRMAWQMVFTLRRPRR